MTDGFVHEARPHCKNATYTLYLAISVRRNGWMKQLPANVHLMQHVGVITFSHLLVAVTDIYAKNSWIYVVQIWSPTNRIVLEMNASRMDNAFCTRE